MKKLLIVNPSQFGYHTDAYAYCKYIKDEYEITYLCWDYGHPRVEEEGVRVVYLPRTGNLLQRMFRFLGSATRETKQQHYDILFIRYFRLCSVLRFTARYGKVVFDVRTGYVRPGWLKGFYRNTLILVESLFFPNVSVITPELRKHLHLPPWKSHVLPLGADLRESAPKRFDAMNLLYVGTFAARDIHKSVEGFGRFAAEFHDKLPMSYDIVGYGSPEEEQRIKDAIKASGVPELYRFHGRVANKLLGPFFDQCNIGVVYVPIVRYQEPQPYTKTFEYLLSGMPALATANATNKQVINRSNGVLHKDSAEGVYEGLKEMMSRLHEYDSGKIKKESEQFTWVRIVNENLRPYLRSLR